MKISFVGLQVQILRILTMATGSSLCAAGCGPYSVHTPSRWSIRRGCSQAAYQSRGLPQVLPLHLDSRTNHWLCRKLRKHVTDPKKCSKAIALVVKLLEKDQIKKDDGASMCRRGELR